MKKIFLLILFFIIALRSVAFGDKEAQDRRRSPEGTVFMTVENSQEMKHFHKQGASYIISRDELVSDGAVREYYLIKNQSQGKKNVFSYIMKIKKEMNFKNSKLDRIAIEYFIDGRLKSIENYKNDNLHGTAKVYYLNGLVKSEENYSSGKKDGISKNYYENGAIMSEDTYAKGVLVSKKIYDIKGKILLERHYQSE